MNLPPLTSSSLFSGRAALIIGIIGTLAMGSAALLPSPWSWVVGVLGAGLAILAGHGAQIPSFLAGAPVLSGTWLTIGKGVAAALVWLASTLPGGWLQAAALTLAGVAAALSGLPFSAGGPAPAAPAVVPPSTPVTNLDDAAKLLGGR